MDFAFTEEQEALRAGARRFLAQQSSPSRVRAAMKTERGWEPEVWQRLCQELGWTSMIVPEAHGGFGAGHVELVGLFEEAGYAMLCAPLLSTVALGTNALLLGHSEDLRGAWLPQIAAGDATATVAYLEGSARGDLSSIETVARRAADGYVLTGVKRFVLDGATATLLVIAARIEGAGSGEAAVALFAVPAETPGVTRTALATMDPTRRMADVSLRDVHLPLSSLLAEPGAGWTVLQGTLQRACVALAAEQVGGAQRCLEMSVEYAKVRVQFGRPIGSFQAIKHRCADMFVDVESARSACYWAGCVAASGDESELALAAATAKAFCSDAFFRTAAETLQVHGGIGITWEHDAHLYFKRAQASELLFGDPSSHREAVARGIGLG